jgi:hypothetical protein
MRKAFAIGTFMLAGLALVASGQAQQTGSTPGSFVGGFTPSNLTFKPVNVGTAAQPGNLQGAMMPQQQSSKVFDIGSAFSKLSLGVFRSQTPNVPVVKPGKGNPIQPVTPGKRIGQ